MGQKVLTTLRVELFHHLQVLSVPYHDQHIVGVTLSRVINDVGVINELLSQGLISLLHFTGNDFHGLGYRDESFPVTFGETPDQGRNLLFEKTRYSPLEVFRRQLR